MQHVVPHSQVLMGATQRRGHPSEHCAPELLLLEAVGRGMASKTRRGAHASSALLPEVAVLAQTHPCWHTNVVHGNAT
jgi:hypothetical protein